MNIVMTGKVRCVVEEIVLFIMVILKGVVLKEYTDIGKHNSGVVCVCFDVDREGWDVWLEFWGVQCQEGHFCVEKWRYDT